MNAIFERSRTKRKYHKLPPCGHRNQICDMEHCRLSYAIKEPKIKGKIDEYLHHREKVIKRRREIELAKIDEENTIDDIGSYAVFNDKTSFKGEFAKRKALKAKYKRNLWKVLWIFLGLVLLASLIM